MQQFDIQKFRYIGSVKVDHLDPSIFCLFTCDSPFNGHPLADVLVISSRYVPLLYIMSNLLIW